jgi:fucose permease
VGDLNHIHVHECVGAAACLEDTQRAWFPTGTDTYRVPRRTWARLTNASSVSIAAFGGACTFCRCDVAWASTTAPPWWGRLYLSVGRRRRGRSSNLLDSHRPRGHALFITLAFGPIVSQVHDCPRARRPWAAAIPFVQQATSTSTNYFHTQLKEHFLPAPRALPAALIRTRVAVALLFAEWGVAISSWAVHIPPVQIRTNISNAVLGSMLLLLGLGALAGMQLAGPLIRRIGAPRLGVIGGLAVAATLAIPLTAVSPAVLGLGLFVFGFCGGFLDIAMNAHAVYVEQRYGRAIMSSFHGLFSIGNVVGASVGTILSARHANLMTSTTISVAMCVLLIAVAAPPLLSVHSRAEAQPEPAIEPESPGTAARTDDSAIAPTGGKRRRLFVLGTLAFLYFLCEGVATDWSGLHARQHLNVSGTLAAAAFAVYVTTMMLGRFLADAVVNRIGAVRLVRGGTILAILGITMVIVSPYWPLTYIGWALFGFGLAGCVPLVFSTAGNVPGASATDLSRVIGMAYIAMLAGPSVIGWATHLIPLNAALAIPLVALGVCLALSGAVERPTDALRQRA